MSVVLDNFQSIASAGVILGVLIMLHEFGHFLICRVCRIRVEKFSIGFGKEVWSFQGKETRYVISLIPFGGYVKPAGEDEDALEGSRPKPGDYLAAPILQRIAVVTAGPVMNWFLAWLLFVIILVLGRPVPMATIGEFVEGYPAQASGLQIGDRILEVNTHAVESWTEMTDKIQEYGADNLVLKVRRGTSIFDITILPRTEDDKQVRGAKLSRIGIKPDMKDVVIKKSPIPVALFESANLVATYSSVTVKALWGLVTGRVSLQAVSGPIGIVRLTAQASNLGLVYVLQLAAILSVSLAVFNLLPIPALDGGHLLFLLIELVIGNPVSLKVQERSTQVCFVLLITLFVVITVNDISHLSLIHKIRAWIPQASTP